MADIKYEVTKEEYEDYLKVKDDTTSAHGFIFIGMLIGFILGGFIVGSVVHWWLTI